jgi:CheY-like chemotaxis protein/phosphoribosyl 1,2-cyclic phosphodiesterase
MRVRFWGTRGSIATPGPSTLRFGGNTSCVEAITSAGHRFIFDCGTGARPLGADLMANAPKPIRATILLGHTHWDHIQGFPFFAPLFVPGNEFVICAPEGVGRSLADVLAGQMEFTYFPVELGQLPSRITYRDLSEGIYEFDGVRVVAQFLNHPALSLGYRIEADGVVLAYLCDHEPFSSTVWREGAPPGRLDSILHDGDRRHATFMEHADLLIHDAQYTPEEYPAKKNWGHATYEYVVELAAAVDVRHLALTHHDPTHDDGQLVEIEQRARALAKQRNFSLHVFCAYEGCSLAVEPPDTDRLRSVEVATASLAVPPSQLRVLVVDDDPNLRELARTALTRDGYAVLEAADGEEGLRLAQQLRPDLVVLDLNMPKLDGITVLTRLRAHPETARLPVLILTAQGDEGSTRTGFQAGATDYLSKPFTIPQLISRVHACCARGS